MIPQLDALHALVEHLEDHPGLADSVSAVRGLGQSSPWLDVQLSSAGNSLPAIAAWARTLDGSVSIHEVAGTGMHLRARGRFAGMRVEVVVVAPWSKRLSELGPLAPADQIAPEKARQR